MTRSGNPRRPRPVREVVDEAGGSSEAKSRLSAEADLLRSGPETHSQADPVRIPGERVEAPHPKVWHVWTLPVPTSTNKLYNDRKIPGKGRRPKTADYRAWIEAAGKTIMAAGPRPQLAGEYLMDVSLPPTGLDLDNGLKALGDLLQSMGIVENDRLCWDLHVRRDPAEPACILRVREK